MSSMNKVILIGRLGRDPESKSFQHGGKMVTLRIATSERWKDRQTGERKEKTEWHQVAILNEHLVPIAERYLRKGSLVAIEGKLQTRKWQDPRGEDRYTTEIVVAINGVLTLLDKPDRDPGAGSADDYAGRTGAGAGPVAGDGGGAPPPDLDDDVPF